MACDSRGRDRAVPSRRTSRARSRAWWRVGAERPRELREPHDRSHVLSHLDPDSFTPLQQPLNQRQVVPFDDRCRRKRRRGSDHAASRGSIGETGPAPPGPRLPLAARSLAREARRDRTPHRAPLLQTRPLERGLGGAGPRPPSRSGASRRAPPRRLPARTHRADEPERGLIQQCSRALAGGAPDTSVEEIGNFELKDQWTEQLMQAPRAEAARRRRRCGEAQPNRRRSSASARTPLAKWCASSTTSIAKASPKRSGPAARRWPRAYRRPSPASPQGAPRSNRCAPIELPRPQSPPTWGAEDPQGRPRPVDGCG